MDNEVLVTVQNRRGIFNEFNDKLLSSTLNDYLVKSCLYVKKGTITLKIKGLSSKKEQENFKKVLHEYYDKKSQFYMLEDSIVDVKRIFLLLLGILLIFISKIFDFILSEIFLVAGWVAIWEIVYDLFFREKERKRNIKIYQKLAKSTIIFEA